MDEISDVMRQWNALHNPDGDGEPERVDAMTFMGGGGEWL